MAITYKEAPEGLVFEADAEGQEELRAVDSYPDRHSVVLESVIGNGLDPIEPAEVGALTNAPIFALDTVRDDQGTLTDAGRVYWFPDYMVRDEWAELMDKGRVVFARGG